MYFLSKPMGSKQSKSKKTNISSETDSFNSCILEYRSDGEKYKLLKNAHGKLQFGNKYVYFHLQKELARDQPRKIYLVFRNNKTSDNNTSKSCLREFVDTAELIVDDTDSYVKNVIDGKEYQELSVIGQNGGKFVLRYSVSTRDVKAYIVYIGQF